MRPHPDLRRDRGGPARLLFNLTRRKRLIYTSRVVRKRLPRRLSAGQEGFRAF